MLKGMDMSKGMSILEKVGSASEFFAASATQLQSITGVRAPFFSDKAKREAMERARSEYIFLEEHNCRPVLYDTPEYPRLLLECPDAPMVLYATGGCDINSKHVISIVGTRRATPYGINFVNEVVSELAQRVPDIVIVSGLAYGIDITSHRAALSAGIPTIGVVAHGLNMIYPASHRNDAAMIVKRGGMIITEYPHDALVTKGNFLARNRIVAGIAECVVVAESARKGGALVTAKIASSYSREVLALPGRTSDLYSQGCNHLIAKNVAHLVTSADDIIDAMGWPVSSPEGHQNKLFVELSPEESRIVEFLRQKGEARLNNISVDLGIPMSRLMSMMVNLEFAGVVIAFPGALYRLN